MTPSAPVPSRPLVDTAQLAERLHLSEREIRRRKDEMGGFKIGRALRFDPDRVDEWLAARIVAGKSEGPLAHAAGAEDSEPHDPPMAHPETEAPARGRPETTRGPSP